VLDGDPAPSPNAAQPPQFSAHSCYGQMAGCINMPLDMEVGLCPGDIVLDGDPAPPTGAQPPSNFRPMSIVAKRLPISATAEHLLIVGQPQLESGYGYRTQLMMPLVSVSNGSQP